MHETDFDIDIKGLSKIEGHTDLDVTVRGGKVEGVRLKINEGKRFYTQAVRGKPVINVHQLVSRICGTCSIAHLTCCIEAVENVLGVQASEQTRLLRNLSMHSLMVRDHMLHLAFFVLPDILGVDSVLDFGPEKDGLVKKALQVKAAGNEFSKAVAGRAVHATTPQVGGFLGVPDAGQCRKVASSLKEAREAALEFLPIFAECGFEFKNPSRYVALVNEKYDFVGGEIRAGDETISKSDFWEHINRVVLPYSQATGFEFLGQEYMVGALARMNLNKQSLHAQTKKDCGEFLKRFPSDNVFDNNLAQGIEIIHSIDRSVEALESFEFKPEAPLKIEARPACGSGVVEAPRGTLYYWLCVGDGGKVKWANLCIPTAQNQVKMQRDVKKLVEDCLAAGKEKHFIEHEIEKLIRAYDPCMSCATHFLKVNWRELGGSAADKRRVLRSTKPTSKEA